jgi:hypothetical protein
MDIRTTVNNLISTIPRFFFLELGFEINKYKLIFVL